MRGEQESESPALTAPTHDHTSAAALNLPGNRVPQEIAPPARSQAAESAFPYVANSGARADKGTAAALVSVLARSAGTVGSPGGKKYMGRPNMRRYVR